MLLGVVSDTHARVETAVAAARLLESLEVACVIHCGDVGSPEIVPIFSAWPAHFVFGNVDDDVQQLRTAISAAGQTCHERFGTLALDGRQIAFLHSDDRRKFDETVASGHWDLVCYGHTHVAEQHHVGKTLVLNPGALHRARPHSFAVVDLQTMQATIIPL
jgi:putative phosphoesterase